MNKNLFHHTGFTAIQIHILQNMLLTHIHKWYWCCDFDSYFTIQTPAISTWYRFSTNHYTYWPSFMLISQVKTSSLRYWLRGNSNNITQSQRASTCSWATVTLTADVQSRWVSQRLSLSSRRTSTAQRTGRCWPAWPPAPTATRRLTAKRPLKNTCAVSWPWRTSSLWTDSDRSTADLFTLSLNLEISNTSYHPASFNFTQNIRKIKCIIFDMIYGFYIGKILVHCQKITASFQSVI